MENERIVKVYSNNSKKARLKRNKNKYQRIWDAEKQKYVKVRKAKYPLKYQSVKIKKEEDINSKMESLKKRQKKNKTPKVKKSVPVNAAQMEMKIAKLNKSEIKQKQTVARSTTIHVCGKNLSWDTKTLRYKAAA